MIRPLRPLAFFALLAIGLPAAANPYSTEKVMARQIPHTPHVQVTFAKMQGITEEHPLWRDADPLDPVWSPLADYTFNAGSGLVTYEAVQHCDCDVPLGSHTYSTRFTATYTDGHSEQFTLEASPITVVADLDDPADAGTVPPDAMPWQIPDPVEVQGIDCAEICAHPPAAADAGALASEARVSPQQGGCSLGGSPASGAWLLGLAGVVLAGLRRHRTAPR
jgi:MYXO-CTERM domain-containing protein